MNAKFKIALAVAWSVLAVGAARRRADTAIDLFRGYDLGLPDDIGCSRTGASAGCARCEVRGEHQLLPLGTGEWQIAGPPGKYRHVFAAPQSGQVAAITTLTEHGVGARPGSRRAGQQRFLGSRIPGRASASVARAAEKRARFARGPDRNHQQLFRF